MNYKSNLSEVLSHLEDRLSEVECTQQQQEEAADSIQDEVATAVEDALSWFDPAQYDLITTEMVDTYVQEAVDAALGQTSRLRDMEHTILALTKDLQDTSASLARLREFVTRETWMDRVKGWFLTLRNRVV